MQNRQSKNPKQAAHRATADDESSPFRGRVVTAVITALAMIASVGLVAPQADAQGADVFVFQGAGWGHGVGMSQNGARNAANLGIDHVGILNFYYPNTVVTPAAPLDNIRVHIGDAPRVELSSAGPVTFERGGVAINAIPSGTISVSAHDGGLQIGNAWTTSSTTDPVYVSFPQPVKVSNNGHSYLWGKFQLTSRNGKVRVVEVLPFEQYVAGIAEMPAAWPLEALMAQAIAARTYAHEITLHRRTSTEWEQEYDISGSTVDQNYIGYDAQDSAWDQKWLAAVSSTAGVEIIDSNGPVRAYYSASNGGYTETAAYVFNNDVAHTVAGPDPYDEGGHDWTEWSRTYSQTQMSRWTNASNDTAVGTVTAINVLDGAGASARIDRSVVEIVGTNGTKRVTGKRLMLVINAGVFGEGGGLSTHLPGTFTTVGNGVGAGAPQPTGTQIVATVTVDAAAAEVDENEGFTPPPGWTPEPGTGVAPIAVGSADAAPSEAAEIATPVLPPGWTPEPGTGVPPIAVAKNEAAPNEAAPPAGSAPVVTPAGTAVPEGWTPEPGTGVAPVASSESATGEADAADAAPAATSVPEGWTPEPGTGVAPVASGEASDSEASDTEAPVPPDGWTPEPGTGVAPIAADDTVGGTGGGALIGDVFIVTRTVAGEPKPVHGVCTATSDGVSCVPLSTLLPPN